MQTDVHTLENSINQQADLCVKCGMCSNQCPTYLIHQNENESPRGRIALAQALASNAVNNRQQIETHINSCLSCLRCEKICPSKVSFRTIMENSRRLLSRDKPQAIGLIPKISHLKYTQWKKLASMYRLAHSSGLMLLASQVIFRKYRNYLRPAARQPAIKRYDEQVQLFAGCLSNLFDQTTHSSLIKLLHACQVSVKIPASQQCCGVLAKHNNLFAEAENCHAHNNSVFDRNKPILFTTSGCGAHLKHDAKQSTESAFQNLEEAGRFLLNHRNFKKLDFAKLEKTVLIHSPCSEKNDLQQSSSLELLQRIPQLKAIKLPDTTPCCGAAGSNMLQNPEIANQIREFSLREIIKAQPEIIVSANYPCAMHIAAGLKQKDLDIKVMHPLSLLQQQLITR